MNRDIGGIINVYKPVGMTSFAVVSRMRKLIGMKRIGHCGTLDPFAEGVLPICTGQATKAVQFMDQYDKRYRVEMVFGMETDTQDRTGTPIFTNKPTEDDLAELRNTDFAVLREAVRAMIGTQEQLPPMYSAIKMNGRPLYEYARKGIDVERKRRTIHVYEANLIKASADGEFRATIDIHCSKGTYIRTLCTDLGKTLSFGAYAESLVRTACGPFQIENSVTPEQLKTLLDTRGDQDPMELLFEKGLCFTPEFALSRLKTIHLNENQALRIVQGQKIPFEGLDPSEEPLLTYCGESRFIGITRYQVPEEEEPGTEHEGTKEESPVLRAERIFVDAANYKL